MPVLGQIRVPRMRFTIGDINPRLKMKISFFCSFSLSNLPTEKLETFSYAKEPGESNGVNHVRLGSAVFEIWLIL